MSESPKQSVQGTKERLASYLSLKFEIENQLERLERLKNAEKIPAISQGDGSQSCGPTDRMANAIIRRMEYEEKILPQIEASRKKMQLIEDAINNVGDPLEREVLRLRYMDGEFCRQMPWREVALSLFGDNVERHIIAAYRLHSRALVSISDEFLSQS